MAQSHTPGNRCVRFVTAVASGHATLAAKQALPLTWAGLRTGWIAPACGWLATLHARNLTSPSFVNLQALLRRLSRICRRLDSEGAQALLSFDDQAPLILLGELARGADDLLDQRR